jgi:aryl-alcohol dehydrogenase-like predicted oxidoreductase
MAAHCSTAWRARRCRPWAAELGCAHWATLVLKWELAHPAVTVAIPATTSPEHVAQNCAAMRGPLPDTRQREAIWRAIEAHA